MTDEHRVEVSTEVPGTPEQVWDVIATGPGIATWFVPAEVEEREGGVVVTYHGPDIEARGVVTAWEPPHRFAYDEPPDEPGTPAFATEFLVEARSGGTCVVRIVTTLTGEGGDWSDWLDGLESGWKRFLDNLRIVMSHFQGQASASIFVTGRTDVPREQARAVLTRAIGLDPVEGDRVRTGPGTPPLAGIVDEVAEDHVMLRLDVPTPGIALVMVYGWKGIVRTGVLAYLFCDEAKTVAGREEPAWRAWMEEHFPPAWSFAESRATAG